MAVHDMHPNLKADNVRRLIAEIGDSLPERAVRMSPLRTSSALLREIDAMTMKIVIGKADTDEGQIPVVCYDQGAWIYQPTCGPFSCGTAACIAGFAHIMLRADAGESVRMEDGAKFDAEDMMLDSLAEFIGVDRETAERIGDFVDYMAGSRSLTRPRHAATLLRNFMETGEVDWVAAKGFDRVSGKLTDGEMRLRDEENRAWGIRAKTDDARETRQ